MADLKAQSLPAVHTSVVEARNTGRASVEASIPGVCHTPQPRCGQVQSTWGTTRFQAGFPTDCGPEVPLSSWLPGAPTWQLPSSVAPANRVKAMICCDVITEEPLLFLAAPPSSEVGPSLGPTMERRSFHHHRNTTGIPQEYHQAGLTGGYLRSLPTTEL